MRHSINTLGSPIRSTLRTLNLYVRLARPLQLTAVFLVYSWGNLLVLATPAAFQPLRYLGGLATLLLAAASIHYANEYADFETDALTHRTPFSGGSGAMQVYNAPRQTALHAAWMALGGAVLSATLAYAVGWLSAGSLALLAAGTLGGWMYSLRPLALAWRGWGEATNALLGGILLPAFGYSIHANPIHPGGLRLIIPFSLLVFTNLLATTWADRHADAHVGKRTLATRWPVRQLRLLYALTATVALVMILFLHGRSPTNGFIWLCLLLLPLIVWAGWAYTRQHSPFPSVFVMVLYLLIQLGERFVALIGVETLTLLN